MQEDFQLNESDMIFIQNLIEATRKDKELKKFIDSYLFAKKSSLSLENINRNIKSLKKMDDTQQLIVKARAREFLELNDPSKHLGTLVGFFGMIIGVYKALAEIFKMIDFKIVDSSLVFSFLVLIVSLILGTYVGRLLIKNMETRSTALFFYELISNLNYDMKNKG
ncbi:hypothetical protein C289_2090 [Anoxybacillus ayderensis]|uniref:hypothetical protein n=1 Tax=Anoxybacillus TaxID=150247 RepID=UPI000385A007|nr:MULTISPECIES: hypothetical protein [Anoxybacillus]EPZ37802.1 hypothetical protein C289_2090 [Anoxybacillus ayderensis]MCZ0754322.1 hypothetical protein [Anoxybacillus sp. J5B_2022]